MNEFLLGFLGGISAVVTIIILIFIIVILNERKYLRNPNNCYIKGDNQ